jgi:serine/threonine-protein kinase ULK/ATG1
MLLKLSSADALKFLRARNIIHRDIKPQNLLLSPYDEVTLFEFVYSAQIPGIPVLQVADFGFARFLPQASMAETLCGSPLYMAPEILRYEKYDAKADLWSCGAVLFEMCTGKTPFHAQNHVELLRRIEKGEDRIKFPEDRPAITTIDPHTGRQVTSKAYVATPVPEDLKDLIKRLLKRNPIQRMAFDDFFADSEVAARSGAAKGLLPAPSTLAASNTRPSNSPSMSMQASSSLVPIDTQEGAFVRPAFASRQSSTPSPIDRPPTSSRKSSFAPKYIVGSAAQADQPALENISNEVKSRDYAQVKADSRRPR